MMPLVGSITSPQNDHVKLVHRLKNKKRDRYREGQYLIEGFRLVQHALSHGCRPAFAFYTSDVAEDELGEELILTMAEGDTLLWQVPEELMAEMSDTVSPQGILAVVSMPTPDADRIRQSSYLLIIDRLRTPGNLGTILRTALATGAGGVVCAKGTVDAFSPKVVRGGMGAHFDLPILTDANWAQILSLTTAKQCVLAEAEGNMTLWDIDWTLPTALIIGSEAHGAGEDARRLATRTAYIPMTQAAESLNAAVAAAAFMFEAQRQRLLAIG